MRQLPLRRIGNDTERGEGQPKGSCDPRRYMRFHIGGVRTRLDVQGAFGGLVDHRIIDTSKIDKERAAKGCGKTSRPCPIAVVTLASCRDDSARDERGAGSKSRRKAACNTKTDDRRSASQDLLLEVSRETRSIAAARKHMDLRTGGKSRLGTQARDRNDPRSAYIPTSTEG